MKSFSQLITENNQTHNPVVVSFGRMNPPTTGHLKLINRIRDMAEKMHAKHEVILSQSQDAKKNPLSPEQKIKHLKRYSPGTRFVRATPEHSTLLHHLARLHAAGHDHLVMVAGSDRVKEYEDLINKYNGVKGRHGYYNFKKIEIRSAGHRDPDAEGEEGMSGTKMREHAKHKDFSSFRQGIPSHVSDDHARELMNDVRQGMGLNEEINRGLFKAIFLTGGPGSGKDIIIREAIAESRFVELSTVQAFDYLADKQKLAERTNEPKREALRNRGPLIINGPADDMDHTLYIKEELEELGYSTMMVFVDTTNGTSKERNERLSKTLSESVRFTKWKQSQKNKKIFEQTFQKFEEFDNDVSFNELEEDITNIYGKINKFIDLKEYNETATDWMLNNRKVSLKDKFDILVQEKKKGNWKAKGPDDSTPDNRKIGNNMDQIKGDTFPRKDPNGKGHSGGAWSGAYSTEQAGPTLKHMAQPKEPNFNLDKDKIKKLKRGDKSLGDARLGKPSGVGQEYDTRAGGQGAAAGAGLGNQTYSEDYAGKEFSNDDVINFAAQTRGPSPNPLNNGDNPFIKKYKKKLKEFNGFQNDVGMGVGGTLGGASNKEPMQSYKDMERNIQNDYGLKIKKKKQEKKNV